MSVYVRYPTAFEKGREVGYGCFTPKHVKIGQEFLFTPERVIPVIFLPGIMGTNLRLTPERQRMLRKKNNIAWNMDKLGEAVEMGKAKPARRQLQLDPAATVVDVYDPRRNPTGDPEETADERHGQVKVTTGSDLLQDDPPWAPNRRTRVQKARARGWGEVLFRSYGEMLNFLEEHLNNGFDRGKLRDIWNEVVGVGPVRWQGQGPGPLTLDELRRIFTNCYYPVHALGYNWLQSNGESAKALAVRIRALMAEYRACGKVCEKVILVTHSMGGLVARALVHPDYGNLQEEVLGIVHGVMPALGAPAAYRRMRAGFEAQKFLDRIVAWSLGDEGDEVTAVLANAPGGLELLPNEAYGNGWLQIRQGGRILKSLPERGDPYTEIYALRDVWYRLIREEWINPANQKPRYAGPAMTQTYLNRARDFHRDISTTYHPLTYAHYGADRERRSYGTVVWEIDAQARFRWAGTHYLRRAHTLHATCTHSMRHARRAECGHASSHGCEQPTPQPPGIGVRGVSNERLNSAFHLVRDTGKPSDVALERDDGTLPQEPVRRPDAIAKGIDALAGAVNAHLGEGKPKLFAQAAQALDVILRLCLGPEQRDAVVHVA